MAQSTFASWRPARESKKYPRYLDKKHTCSDPIGEGGWRLNEVECDHAAAILKAFVETSPWRSRAAKSVEAVPVPERLPVPEGKERATQAAFGGILLDLAKSGHPLADRIVTTSPDVTVSTNLSPGEAPIHQ